tara:strand:- start:45 stop:272 length:228 start_codon:yes stop_codon:yes gene_type:complete
MAKKQPPKLANLRYRFNKLIKEGDYKKAKELSRYSQSIHGVNLDEEYHAKLSSKEDPRDPFGLGRIPGYKKQKYG